jgi:tetratricopeptide (TPR) repeat protein
VSELFQFRRNQKFRCLQTARQRLGVRQPAAAVPPRTKTPKAAEGRHTPKPRGTFLGARRIGCHVLLTALFLAVNLTHAATNDLFAQGVALSRAGQFPEAVAAFEKSAQARPAAGTFVNLGIAEWRRGHAGAAILAWEQARWIDPFNARAGANLEFAREATQVDAPQLKWYETASTWLPPDVWAWLTAASLWLAVGLITLPAVLRWRKAGWHQVLAAFAFGVFLFSVTADFGVSSRTQIGFVLKKDAPLLLTPTRDAETVTTLAAGEPARRLRTQGNYFFIRAPFAAGWIRRDQFGLICPGP